MKVSSQVLSIALLAGYVAANERGRQNDWHKVTKPDKFKPNAPRNEGKVLREDDQINEGPNNDASHAVIPSDTSPTIINGSTDESQESQPPVKNSAVSLESILFSILGLLYL